MSAEAVGWVWKNSPMRKSALLVHLALADVTNDMHGNQLWCSVATVASKTHLDRSTVMAALDRLVAAKLLVEVERPGRTTLYQFLFPEAPVGNPDTLSDMPTRESDTPVGNPDTPVGESDPTCRKSRHELNRTQDEREANNLSAPQPEICRLWVEVQEPPIAGQRTPPPTVAACVLPAEHEGPCKPLRELVAITQNRSDLQ